MKTTMNCNSVDYCTELVCDYAAKNSHKIADKAFLKLVENMCNSYDNVNSEFAIFSKYFFNMGLIVFILGFLLLETQRNYRIQSHCDRIDGIFDEFETGITKNFEFENSKNSNLNDNCNKNLNEMNIKKNYHIFEQARKCELNNIMKDIPYWANIFKLKRTEHKPELSSLKNTDGKLKRHKTVIEPNWKRVYEKSLKDISREVGSMNYRRFLTKNQNKKKSESRTNYRQVVRELNKVSGAKRYREFIKNFDNSVENKLDNEFVKVQKPGWGWFGF